MTPCIYLANLLGGQVAFRENSGVQARFLLGPAGSGKTFRCVAEVRAELLRSPAGSPLIFLAPKQATFQIERQLLTEKLECPDATLAGEMTQPLTLSPGQRKTSNNQQPTTNIQGAPVLPALVVGCSPVSMAGGTPRSGLRGYSRLHILSFERLAAFVFDRLGLPVPELLSEEGRVMVLRALLARHHPELKIFRASARLTGFATQLSLLLRELQRSRVGPERLQALAGKVAGAGRLNEKLHDLALLLEHYEGWLAARRAAGRHLDDANRLLDLATEALQQASMAGRKLNLGALWLDGFAEMTPQETALLAALVPHCERATLAFCLEGEPHGEISWLSPWTVVGRTFNNCREALKQSLRADPQVEILPRDPSHSRFGDAPELAGLERVWASGGRRAEGGVRSESRSLLASAATIRLIGCPNAEAEATLAARQILQHAQAGGRFRDCAILVRSLDGCHDVLRRVLGGYEIPFFLDRREAVAHHPLAELTRYALRTVAFDWRQEDWFGALKTGLVRVRDEDVDQLENEALKRGWEGGVWRKPLVLADDATLAARLEETRLRLLPAFEGFADALHTAESRVTGCALARAIRNLWSALEVEAGLDAWSEAAADLNASGAVHTTVWTQLTEWLAGLELAFADEALPVREWLPVLEAGLAGMTVGVIPPSLDQVLVGSVDRSRNPDLQIAFVLGVNEGVFPQPPTPAVLLTDSDRSELEAHGVTLGASARQHLGHERYLGYIALTRARRQVVVTWATADADGGVLNASAFVAAIKRAVPGVAEETFISPAWTGAMHRVELPEHVLTWRSSACESAPFQSEAGPCDAESKCESGLTSAATEMGVGALAALPEFAELIQRWEQVRDAAAGVHLSPEAAGKLYGNELKSSVSALEDFAACPFRFLAARGLRAQEREEFVADAREKGSFQHDVLQVFHERVRSEQKQWRDLTPTQAGNLVREIGAATVKTFRGGLMDANAAARFTANVLIANLAQLMETLVGWMPHYQFDPTAVEVSFGLEGAELPAWTIPLTAGRVLKLRGRIDRIDLCRTADGGALLVICDYKSGGKQMDPVKIENGLELQLLSYLAALTQMPEAGVLFKVDRLQPAGAFYVPLRARPGSGKTRGLALDAGADVSLAFQHRGRFAGAALAQFDDRSAVKGEQFRFKVNKGGEFSKTGNEALAADEFPALVAGAEAKLRDIGEGIFRGEAAVDPYRLKQQTACDYCAYRPVCRFDPWTMSFRKLKEAGV